MNPADYYNYNLINIPALGIDLSTLGVVGTMRMSNAISRLSIALFLVTLLLVEALALAGAAEEVPEPVSTRGGFYKHDFDNADDLSVSGHSAVTSGSLTLDPQSMAKWTDTFNRANIAPWTEWDPKNEASVIISNNQLKTTGGTSPQAGVKAERSIDESDFKLTYKVNVAAKGNEGPSCQLLQSNGWGMDLDLTGGDIRLMTGRRGGFSSIYRTSYSYSTGTWIDVAITIKGTSVTCEFGTKSFTKTVSFSSNIQTIAIGIDRSGVAYYDDVSLKTGGGFGTATTSDIALPPGNVWDRLKMDYNLPTDTFLYVDVLDGVTEKIVPGYEHLLASDINITGIHPVLHPTIKLRATLYTYSLVTPDMDWWSVHWIDLTYRWMGAFDDDVNLTLDNGTAVRVGRLTTSNVRLDDSFDRYVLGPWAVQSGSVKVLSHNLVMEDTTGAGASASMDIDPLTKAEAAGMFRFDYLGDGVVTFELRSSTTDRLMFQYDDTSASMRIYHYDGTMNLLGSRSFYLSAGQWYTMTASYDGEEASFKLSSTTLTVDADIGKTFDAVGLACSTDDRVSWSYISVSTPLERGTVISEPIDLPPFHSWVSMDMVTVRPSSSVLNISLLDGETLDPIPGFENLSGDSEDMDTINPRTHSRIRIHVEMEGIAFDVPYLDWIRIFTKESPDAIRQVMSFNDINMVEDTPVQSILNVTDYFDSKYTIPEDLWYNISFRSDPEHVYPYLDGFELSIDLPSANWSGNTYFRINVTNPEGTLGTTNIRVNVAPVDDPPVLAPLPDFVIWEGAIDSYDLSSYIYDIDTLPGQMRVSTSSSFCSVQGLELRFYFSQGGFEEHVTVQISDAMTTVTAYLKVIVLEVNDDPTVMSLPTQMLLEDKPKTVDLFGYLDDEETSVDQLVIYCEHPNAIDVFNQSITFLFTSYTPEQVVEFSVFDGSSSVSGTFNIQVETVNDPPLILGLGEISPPFILELNEGDELWLPLMIEDEDSNQFFYSVKSNWDGITVLTNGTVRITTKPGELGTFMGTIHIDDRGGGLDQANFTIIVNNVNDPPAVPVILSPINGSKVEEGTSITFRVNVDDPDLAFGDVLEVTWTSDLDGILMVLTSDDDLSFVTDQLIVGTHTIIVMVSDGEFTREASLDLTILAKEVPPDPDPDPDPEPEPQSGTKEPIFNLGMMIAVVVAGVVVALVIVITMMRKGSPPEMPPEGHPIQAPSDVYVDGVHPPGAYGPGNGPAPPPQY